MKKKPKPAKSLKPSFIRKLVAQNAKPLVLREDYKAGFKAGMQWEAENQVLTEVALKYEIEEIICVARDNPKGLQEFLMLNFPKEWGLTKTQHKALFKKSGRKKPK